ncbi:MAG: hypothetical protein KC416_15505 [Myxococcales bacterium]|nr:hypothetical protein [Myxococcales bacterium]
MKRLHRALPDVPIVYYLDDLDELEKAANLGASAVRIPTAVESDLQTQQTVIEAGYTPLVSGTYTQWNGGLAIVNNMRKTSQRRRDRRPDHCPPTEP